MLAGINFHCEYLDMVSCGCRFIDSTDRVPVRDDDSGTNCLVCLIGLYKARGDSGRVS